MRLKAYTSDTMSTSLQLSHEEGLILCRANIPRTKILILVGICLVSVRCSLRYLPSRFHFVPINFLVGTIQINQPLPYEAAVLITQKDHAQLIEKKGHWLHHDPKRWKPDTYGFRPGEALERGLPQALSHVFQKVELIRTPEQAQPGQLIVIPVIDHFHLDWQYEIGWSYENSFVSTKSEYRVSVLRNGTVLWKNKSETPWQKEAFPRLPALLEVSNSASRTLSLVVKQIAEALASDPSFIQTLEQTSVEIP